MAHGVSLLSLARQPGAVWRQGRSDAVLVDRIQELPPAEAAIDLYVAAKCRWADTVKCPSTTVEVGCRAC